MVDVKSNFKNQYGSNLTCDFCRIEVTQPHLLWCKEVSTGIDTSEVQYSDIFADIEKQEKIAKILRKILKQRIMKTKLLSVENESLSLGTLSQ